MSISIRKETDRPSKSGKERERELTSILNKTLELKYFIFYSVILTLLRLMIKTE